MKKSVLSIVAIAFAAVSVLSSCDKNDDGYGQSAKPAVQSTTSTSASSSSNSSTSTSSSSTNTQAASYAFHGKCIFVSDSLAQLGTFKVVVTDGEKSAEYDLLAQGEHGTKTFKTEDNKTVSATGYFLKVILPTTNDLQWNVTYEPSEKAKTMTENDLIGVAFIKGIGKGNTSDVDFAYQGTGLIHVKGDKVLGFCKELAINFSE